MMMVLTTRAIRKPIAVSISSAMRFEFQPELYNKVGGRIDSFSLIRSLWTWLFGYPGDMDK
jgi:hypothetical protein